MTKLSDLVKEKTIGQATIDKVSKLAGSSLDGVKTIVNGRKDFMDNPTGWLQGMPRGQLISIVSLAIVLIFLVVLFCVCKGICRCRRRGTQRRSRV